MAPHPSGRPRGEPASPAAPHRLTVRVYYEDTDFSGVVYHASYLRLDYLGMISTNLASSCITQMEL